MTMLDHLRAALLALSEAYGLAEKFQPADRHQMQQLLDTTEDEITLARARMPTVVASRTDTGAALPQAGVE